ncbi:MAG TPA: ATP-binding protein [Cyclobacteriaceae bacterium]|nr:ATP-binding protein [Cyclobacteriaceae bacterium]
MFLVNPIGKLICFFILMVFCVSKGISQAGSASQSWAEVEKNHKGTIIIYWDQSKPFIFTDGQKKMAGIEYELMEGFKTYLKKNYNVDLTIRWEDAKSFKSVYDRICNLNQPGIFGASAFSITDERLERVNFSPSYMSDISVLITSKDVPIVENYNEFKTVFAQLSAVTIKETTYEKELLEIQKKNNLSFPILYIPSSGNILRTIESRRQAFGFIDLPVYMMMFNNDPSININRQNLFPIKGDGYGIIFPKQSDWDEPLRYYFHRAKFRSEFKAIVSKYIDYELHSFIENLAAQSNNEIVLLTKEKEIQYKELLEKESRIKKETLTRNYLITLVVALVSSFIVIIALYQKSRRQKKKIEAQQINIQKKKETLEQRNEHLILLDEEKNNLIRILAHDLRAPVNHIHGLAQVLLMNYDTLSGDQKTLVQQIKESSIRVSKMIISILDIDALENNRVQVLKENINIHPILVQVIKEFEKHAQKKQIEVQLKVDKESYIIHADSLFLVQVFENLLSNALKFSEKEKQITISAIEENKKIYVSFKDQGPGLSAEDMTKLYKKFERLSARPTQGESSTGLGLSIVKKYVELMGGEILCESEPGNGATFTVTFEKAALV